MTAKVVEAVAKILEKINNNISLEDVSKELSATKEFDKQTVTAAFGLLYDKFLINKKSKFRVKNKKNKDFRILNEEEREILGLENYDYLLRLNNVGLLDNVNMELLLEQIMMFPAETISREDINWIILLSLVDFDKDIMPGSRVLLYSSDTIN